MRIKAIIRYSLNKCLQSLLSFGSSSLGFFKGTSADQDRRFSDKELKLLKSMKFPPEFEKKVYAACICMIVFTYNSVYQG